MRRYLVDTNVVLDMLLDRAPYADSACAIFDASTYGDFELCLCSLSFSNIYYILRPEYGKERTINGLRELAKTLTILPVDGDVTKKALFSKFTDFEDALQYYSARDYGVCDGIITRNAKDFRLSEIPVIDPAEFGGRA